VALTISSAAAFVLSVGSVERRIALVRRSRPDAAAAIVVPPPAGPPDGQRTFA
jgi:hypothetical protein